MYSSLRKKILILGGSSDISKELINKIDKNKYNIYLHYNKNKPLNNTESVLLGEFEYDFETIHKSEYFLNPNSISKLKTPIQLKFFHTNKQQKHITNQQKLYSNHALGLGRLLQQTNLSLVFRSFEQNQ